MLAYVREQDLVRAGDRIAIAVSGGADSVALLRVFLEIRSELGIVLSVAHFDHQIRGADSQADAAFVRALAEDHGLEIHLDTGDARSQAAASGRGLEAAARELRHAFFSRLLDSSRADKLATAHTLDDQAETVLMKFLRGAGTRGLSGIHPVQSLGSGPLVRPFLNTRRMEIEQYLRSLGQPWREDTTNFQLSHRRNRVRHELLPLLLRDYNPGLVDVLGHTAEVARAEEEFWEAEIEGLRDLVPGPPAGGDSEVAVFEFKVPELSSRPLAVRRRIVRHHLATDYLRTEAILALLHAPAGAKAELGRGFFAVRSNDSICIYSPHEPPQSYCYPLAVPGEVRLEQLGLLIRAAVDPARYNPATCYLILTVRNWQPGDRFWPEHRSSPKKVKELLQERDVHGRERVLWPVVAHGEKLVWLHGFGQPDPRHAPDAAGIYIESMELS